jgi:uncharacterized damage-inducible protein DinB
MGSSLARNVRTMIDRIDPSVAADERTTLLAFLDWYRATLLLKADGLTDEQARTTSVAPSTLNLMGLVRHMAEVERNWFQRCMLDRPAEPLFYTEDEELDLHPPPDATLAEAVAALLAEIAAADQVIAGHGLDDVSVRERRTEDGGTFHPNLRWILVHMIEEYARHAGHADLLREAIDGVTGD